VGGRILGGPPGPNNGSSLNPGPNSEQLPLAVRGGWLFGTQDGIVALSGVLAAVGLATDASAQPAQVEQGAPLDSAAAVRSETHFKSTSLKYLGFHNNSNLTTSTPAVVCYLGN
jgi:hypothetical protein